MPAPYTVKDLAADKIAQAYPVIRAGYPHVTLDEWSVFAKRRIRPTNEGPSTRGILVVETARGYMQGLFCYYVMDDALGGRTFVGDTFVVLDVIGVEAPLAALLRAAERRAGDFGCDHVSLCLPSALAPLAPPESRVCSGLLDSGHVIESIGFRKRARLI